MKTTRTLKLFTFLIIAIISAQACKAIKQDSDAIQLSIFQNGKEIPVNKPEKTVHLKKSPFSLRFFNRKYDLDNKKFYAAQIAAFTNKAEFDKITIGSSKADLAYFKPGSGMATHENSMYEALFVDKIGHHYTFYQNTNNRRLNLLDDTGELPKFEFEINALHYNHTRVNISDSNINKLYIAFLIDKNLNGIIDKGELHKLIIKLK
ncbi:hypothetical protein GGR32_002281 [Mesonia hippocampi]|uniref:EF-hand domain-containing protein n=1 Tax=Mesonia hippocampi TaxID=1628250 RepID=A0A840ENL2_9FLAO|nr:hypothetical protein [Mesonia hippocampi]MBB4119969.1 hypothetical protein [Mesonia hippocampi]